MIGSGSASERFSSDDSRYSRLSQEVLGSDSMDQSFSESFLREAGAGMLAGLDDEMWHSSPKASPGPVMETPRPARMVDITSDLADGLHHSEEEEDEAVKVFDDVAQTPMPKWRESLLDRAARSPSPPVETSSPLPEASSPAQQPPSQPEEVTDSPQKVASPKPVSPSLSGTAPPTPIPASEEISPAAPPPHRTPGNVSVATTAAEFATPQWSGPAACDSSSNSIDASPSREKAERRLLPYKPPRLAAAPWQAGSPSADLSEIVSIISQLDHAHTERGRYLVSRAQQAESKFALLSEALRFSQDQEQRLRSDYAAACEKVHALQGTVDGIMAQYEASKQEGKMKNDEVETLVRKLTAQMEKRSEEAKAKAEEAQRALEEEKRARACERQDWEVRLHRAETLSDSHRNTPPSLVEEEKVQLVQETRSQTMESCRRDFEVRRHIEQQDLKAEIDRLQKAVDEASKPSTSGAEEEARAEAADLRLQLEEAETQNMQISEKVAELEDQLYESRGENGRLEEELAAQRSDAQVEALTAELETSMATIEDLRNELQQASDTVKELEAELAEREHQAEEHSLILERSQREHEAKMEEAERNLQGRDSMIQQLERDLEDALSQLPDQSFERRHASLQAEVESLTAAHHSALAAAKVDSERLTAQLELAQSDRATELAALREELIATQRDKEDVFTSLTELEKTSMEAEKELSALRARVAFLERELSARVLESVKLTKAKDVLEDENTNYGIALSAKQLELSMLKRNARIALGDATPRRNVLQPLDENTPGELQKGPAELRATRRRTMDPATVINVGRLRPKLEAIPRQSTTPTNARVSAVATPAQSSVSARSSVAPTSSSRISAAPTPARRRSNAVAQSKPIPTKTPLTGQDDPMRLDELANSLSSTIALPAPRRTAPRRSLLPA